MVALMHIVKDRDRRAELSHAIAGVLYYRVDAEDGSYMFPVDMNDRDDVGTSTFNASEKAITLMRYVRRAIGNDSLVRIK